LDDDGASNIGNPVISEHIRLDRLILNVLAHQVIMRLPGLKAKAVQ
jgi:hypothetical protein